MEYFLSKYFITSARHDQFLGVVSAAGAPGGLFVKRAMGPHWRGQPTL